MFRRILVTMASGQMPKKKLSAQWWGCIYVLTYGPQRRIWINSNEKKSRWRGCPHNTPCMLESNPSLSLQVVVCNHSCDPSRSCPQNFMRNLPHSARIAVPRNQFHVEICVLRLDRAQNQPKAASARQNHRQNYSQYCKSASHMDSMPHNFWLESTLTDWILIHVAFLYFARRSSHSLNHDFSIRQIHRKGRGKYGFPMRRYEFCNPMFLQWVTALMLVFLRAEAGSPWTKSQKINRRANLFHLHWHRVCEPSISLWHNCCRRCQFPGKQMSRCPWVYLSWNTTARVRGTWCILHHLISHPCFGGTPKQTTLTKKQTMSWGENQCCKSKQEWLRHKNGSK